MHMNCIVCNKEIEESNYTNEILCSCKCFSINFWNGKVKAKDDPNIVRIKGNQYYIKNEDSKSPFRGYCGSLFKIRFFDGREIVTTNLWYNGEIPMSHREMLPDNAEFVGAKIK